MDLALWICGIISIPLVFLYYMYITFISLLPRYEKKYTNSYQKIEQPYFIFCIPCLNEEKVIKKTIESILQLNYERLFIVVIDDASDDDSLHIVQQLNDVRIRIHRRQCPNARLGKGDALNDVYKKICKLIKRLSINPHQVILTVVDGDGRPSNNLLQEAKDAFSDPLVGAAQTNIRMTNLGNWLSLMQDVEFYTNVAMIQNSREYLQSVGLGGNGQFSRLSAMQELGTHPWSDCLLEDFDFGLSLLLRGWKIRHLSHSAMYQQSIISIPRFIRQRSRWAQGNMQCLRRSKEILQADLSLLAKFDIFYFLLQPWMTLIGSLVMILSWIYLGVFFYNYEFQFFMDSKHRLQNISAVFIWIILVFGPGLFWGIRHYQFTRKLSLHMCSWSQCILAGLSMPIYNILVIPSVWMAYLRHLTKRKAWLKTDRIEENN
ncbi:glycosyltransferase family 2 protein [Bacillus wiedmannii]|uniref:Glycosyltransferase family 2 protein n=1 Tax=Bacillus wiedmannii TaxID=1890302 RepID=A0A4U2N6M9_9BACI|nr:glycosyltransferase family 2 protein [Bacillus wiedmannii]TKH18974.1 glycosyltransferase family 2 protein [Bacillus wiedmannii]